MIDTSQHSHPYISLITFLISGVSYVGATWLPSMQGIAYGVAIASGLFSIANVLYGWIKKTKSDE